MTYVIMKTNSGIPVDVDVNNKTTGAATPVARAETRNRGRYRVGRFIRKPPTLAFRPYPSARGRGFSPFIAESASLRPLQLPVLQPIKDGQTP